jgi:hypothetical protein
LPDRISVLDTPNGLASGVSRYEILSNLSARRAISNAPRKKPPPPCNVHEFGMPAVHQLRIACANPLLWRQTYGRRRSARNHRGRVSFPAAAPHRLLAPASRKKTAHSGPPLAPADAVQRSGDVHERSAIAGDRLWR